MSRALRPRALAALESATYILVSFSKRIFSIFSVSDALASDSNTDSAGRMWAQQPLLELSFM
jgi:hypothetical protein